MVLVDSSVWIEGLRRNGSLEVKLALEGLLDVYEAQLCDPVRLEVLGGARKSERKKLSACFALLPFRACTHEDWALAMEISWKLRDAGVTVPWMDVLIAAIGLRESTRVYSVDKHFVLMSETLGLLLYQPGYGGMYQD
jgi:predicted nucleic acid-binding protein